MSSVSMAVARECVFDHLHNPAWRAQANGISCKTRRDALGLIVLEPECNGRCAIDLFYDGLSVAAKKGTKMAAKWSPARGAVRSEPFPLLRSVVRNGPERSRARRCWARRSEPLTARTVLR